jgi:RND family efflux transporter MFP subunit
MDTAWAEYGMKRVRTLKRAACMLACFALLPFPGMAVAQKRAAAVKVDRIVQEPLSQTMPIIGRLIASQTGIVAALTRGPVADVLVAVGDRVQKGDVLATLVTDRMRWSRALQAANLKAKQAGLQTAKAQLGLTEQELSRLANLRKSAAFSQARHEDKQNEVIKYRSEVGERLADVGNARAALRLADIDMYNGKIRAPYNAVVTQKHTVAGAYVNVGDPVVTLVNEEALEIEANVPSERVGGLIVGRTVDIRFDDGGRHEAVVRALIPEENPLTRTRPVRLSPAFDGSVIARLGLAANQSVTVMVPIGKPRDVVSVHKDAVIPRGGQSIVFAAVDGKAERRVVRLGSAIGSRFEVLDGLGVGDLVVVRGNERLRPGQAIKYPGMPEIPKEPNKPKKK